MPLAGALRRAAGRLRSIRWWMVVLEGADLVDVRAVKVEKPVPRSDRDRVPEVLARPGREEHLEVRAGLRLLDELGQLLDVLVRGRVLVPDDDAAVLQVVHRRRLGHR